MPMRGGSLGYGIPGGTQTGSTTVNGYTVPQDLTLSGNRTGAQPAEYVAASNVEFTGEFESASSDEFSAYIADASYAGTGNKANGGTGANLAGGYRYGFNGKENDEDVKGDGNQYDYGFRVYDPRIGKFLSVDPLQKKYAELTPYQFSSNSPIDGVDLDGRERIDQRLTQESDGTTKLRTLATGQAEERKLLTFWKVTQVPAFYRVEYNQQHYIFADAKDRINIAVNYTDLATVYTLEDYHNFITRPDISRYESTEESSSARVRGQMIYNYKVLLAYGMTSYPAMEKPKSATPTIVTNETTASANSGIVESSASNEAATVNRGRGVAYEKQNQSPAQTFENAAEGASSDIVSRNRIVPTLKYDNPNSNGSNYVKLDTHVGELNFIDRKLNVTGFPKSIKQIQNQAEALRQNPGSSIRYEVPANKVNAMKRLLIKAGQERNSQMSIKAVTK